MMMMKYFQHTLDSIHFFQFNFYKNLENHTSTMTDPYGYYFENNNEQNSSSPKSAATNDWYTGTTTGNGNVAPTSTVYPSINTSPGWDAQDPFGGGVSSNQGSFSGYGYSSPPPGPAPAAYPNYYAQQQQPPTNMFIPTMPMEQNKVFTDDDIENEPPLLEELGVNFDHIRLKTLAVLNPMGTTSPDVIADQDLAGPLVFCLLFAVSLLLHGKIHFGHIYGIGMVGCTGMYALLNLMAQQRSITFTNTASILGYCLLPMSLLSLLAAVLSLQALLGYVIVALAVFWSGLSSSKLFTIALSMHGQRFLVAYPCILLYSVFALLAIF